MRRALVAPVAAVALLGLAQFTEAAPGDPRVVRGLIEWAAGPAAPFVVLRGDDGRHYYVDVSRLQGPRAAFNRGDRAVVTGVEGYSAHEIGAVTVQAGAAPAVALTPPGTAAADVPPASPAPAEQGPAADPSASIRTEPPPVRLEGRVESISGNTVVLRTSEGQNVTVNMASVGSNMASMVRPGDDLTVFGRPDRNRAFVASGYVLREPAPARTTPGPRR
jgi:hypothetical protein